MNYCSECKYLAPASNVHNDPEGECFHPKSAIPGDDVIFRPHPSPGRNALLMRRDGPCGMEGTLFEGRVGAVKHYWEHSDA